MSSLRFRLGCTVAMALAGNAGAVRGQVSAVPDYCSSITQVAQTRPATAVRYDLARCGNEGRIALRSLVQTMRGSKDSSFIDAVVAASDLPDAIVGSLAEGFATDRSVVDAKRLAGIRMLARQAFGSGADLRMVGGSNLAPRARCALIRGAYALNQRGAERAHLARVATGLARDLGESETVRSAAYCVMVTLEPRFQWPQDLRRLQLSAACGTRAQIVSSLGDDVVLDWKALGTSQGGRILAPARRTTLFFTHVDGVVEFTFNGDKVGSVRTQSTPCAPETR